MPLPRHLPALLVLLALLLSACAGLDMPTPGDQPAAGDSDQADDPADGDGADAGGPEDPTAPAAPVPGDDADTDGSDGGDAGVPFKGVGFSEPGCEALAALGASWFYNWAPSGPSCDAIEYVPMIWGGDQADPDAIADILASTAAGGHDTVLGFNEPDRPEQANLSVDRVLELWPAMTADDSIAVGAPATASDPDGQAWLEEFLTRADQQGLRIDVLPVHWYGWGAGSCTAEGLDGYLDWVESLPGDQPIWITEVGCLHESNGQAGDFYPAMVEMLADHPRVERYAWFPYIDANQLLLADGALTPLGEAFAAAPSTR